MKCVLFTWLLMTGAVLGQSIDLPAVPATESDMLRMEFIPSIDGFGHVLLTNGVHAWPVESRITVTNPPLGTTVYAVIATNHIGESEPSNSVTNVNLLPRTNWIATYHWRVVMSNEPAPAKFLLLFGSDDLKQWRPFPAIQTVTRTNY